MWGFCGARQMYCLFKNLRTMKRKTYYVVVGNVGTMEYTSLKLAQDCYTTYVTMSKSHDATRAYGEDVNLLSDSEIIKSHSGHLQTSEF